MTTKAVKAAMGLMALVNFLLLGGVVALVVSQPARDAIADRIGLAPENELKRLEQRVFDLESAVGDSGVDDLASRIDDVELRIDDFASGAGDVAVASVDDLSSRVDDLESEIFNLESEFEARASGIELRVDDPCSNLSFEFDVFC